MSHHGEHDWLNLGSNQVKSHSEARHVTRYECRNCPQKFQHRYQIEPSIRRAMLADGIPIKCPNAPLVARPSEKGSLVPEHEDMTNEEEHEEENDEEDAASRGHSSPKIDEGRSFRMEESPRFDPIYHAVVSSSSSLSSSVPPIRDLAHAALRSLHGSFPASEDAVLMRDIPLLTETETQTWDYKGSLSAIEAFASAPIKNHKVMTRLMTFGRNFATGDFTPEECLEAARCYRAFYDHGLDAPMAECSRQEKG